MVVTSFAKINIGLTITGKREDGYHLLESLMIPIPLFDIIEIIENKSNKDNLYSFGIVPDVKENDNLIIKAVKLFRKECLPQLPYLDIAIYKNIPFGAGMGGGSSNATTMIKTLRDYYTPQITDDYLRKLVLQLGADCPFFVSSKPQIARGIGEILSTEENFSLSNKYLLLIKPNINISTREAFAGISISKNINNRLEDCIYQDIYKWQDTISNDFEKSLFPIYPVLKDIKDWMISNGSQYSSLTGSGATMYSISNLSMLDKAKKRYPDLFVWECLL